MIQNSKIETGIRCSLFKKKQKMTNWLRILYHKISIAHRTDDLTQIVSNISIRPFTG